MTSFRQLLAAHPTVLVLDAASSRIQVGWLAATGGTSAAAPPAPGSASSDAVATSAPWSASPTGALSALGSASLTAALPAPGTSPTATLPAPGSAAAPGRLLPAMRWQTSDEEAGIGVFRCVEALGINVADASAFVFCDGPGSILGIRTVAMALRIWGVLNPRPVFDYCSLALVAQALGRPEAGVIADARRDTWHYYRLGGGLVRTGSAALQGELVMPEHFRHWSALPAGVRNVPYDLSDLLPRTWDADLLQPTDHPDAFLHEEPNYATWTPQIHRAPTAS